MLDKKKTGLTLLQGKILLPDGKTICLPRVILNSRIKKEIAPKIKKGGIAISFGWNTVGFGKVNGFEIIEILIISHGGAKNDTLCTVERKQ